VNVSQLRLRSEKYDDDDNDDDDNNNNNNNRNPWGCYDMLFGVLYPTFRRIVVTSSSVPENCLALSMTAVRPLDSFWDYLHKDAGQYPRRSETSAIPPLGKSISQVYVK
jgi:hypothetical protein